MSKGERELRRLLRDYPRAVLESGRSGYTLHVGGRSMNLGGLQSGLHDRNRIERFLKGAK
jgi:hypothetical protein